MDNEPKNSLKVLDHRKFTADGFENFAARVGTHQDNQFSQGHYEFSGLTRNRTQLEAMYRTSWVVGTMIDGYAKDMTRAGVDVTTNESKADIADFQSKILDLAIMNSLAENISWGGLYGGSIAVLQIEGQDESTPLMIDRVGRGQFKGLTVYDRWQLNPAPHDMIEIGPNIGLPKYYDVVTTSTKLILLNNEDNFGRRRIHHSRVIRSIGHKLPYFQAITEMMWGQSKVERMFDRLLAFDHGTMSSANLIERANNRTIFIDKFREICAMGGDAMNGLAAQFDMMRLFQSNEGITLGDKADDYKTDSYTFSGLDELLMQYGQQLAGAIGMPLVRIFGQSPAGLNATGENDLRMYYDNINAEQNATMRAGMNLVLRVLWRSCYGVDAPKDFNFSFVPLWQMSSKEKADLAKTKTEAIIRANESGGIKRGTMVKELRGMAHETGLFSNITDEEVDEAELADQEPLNEPIPENENDQTEPTKTKIGDSFLKRLFRRKRKKPMVDSKKKIHLLVGAPASGKTWITKQVEDKFHVIHHDGFIYLKQPGAYVQQILSEAPSAEKPVLIEAPFSMSETVDPLVESGYEVEPIFIIEDAEVHATRYLERDGKPIPRGHLTRTQTYLKRAIAGNHFYGTSSDVLKHLKSL